MTNYIILALCIIVLLSYFFDITSRFSRIPGVILLIGLGIVMKFLVDTFGLRIPNMQPILPVIGTLGLILIVMEASLDLKLERKKTSLIISSVSSAIVLFSVFVLIATYILVRFKGYTITSSLLNSIPLGIISSAVAISSASSLGSGQREFVIYESSFSDIVGILVFDFILLNQGAIAVGIFSFLLKGLITIILALAVTSVLSILLHKTTYHVNYVIILTSVVLVYVLAKISHLPALFLVLVFGLALSNNQFAEHSPVRRIVDFKKFRKDVESFRSILGELTFLIRSFFFIMFGYYTQTKGLLNPDTIGLALAITAGIFILRWIFFTRVLKMPAIPLVPFAPRGLITILLFMGIPQVFRIPVISEELITLVIFFSIFMMMIGNIMHKNEPVPSGEEIRKGEGPLLTEGKMKE
jgi:Kef-type K+ transport system membrane component KefB